MQPLDVASTSSTGDGVVRLPGPWEVIRPADSDLHDWERFPRGLPHLIGTDGPYGMVYEVRVRTHNGMLYVMPFASTDPEKARERLWGFRGTLALTYDDTRDVTRTDPAEVQRGMEFELASGVDHRARIASGAYDPYAIAHFTEFDAEDEERFPHAYLVPLALGVDDDGLEKFGVALSWLGQLIPYRLEALDLDLSFRELRARIAERHFIEVFEDPNECKAAVLFAMAENIFLWGSHVARRLPEHAGRPEWGPLSGPPPKASRPGRPGR